MPALVPVVDRLEDVPEAARTFYVQKDGKFHVDLSGAPVGFVSATELAAANVKVIEFRDSNIALTKKINELEPVVAKFKDIDPDAARSAITKVAELEKKGVKGADDVQAMITAAVTAAVKPVQDQFTALQTSAAADRKRADDGTLRTVLMDKFNKAGGLPGASDFIFSKAQPVFVVENGVVKAGPNQFSSDKPGELITMDEWLTRQTKESDFAFKSSNGGGASPAPGGGGGAGGRPGVTILKDPTPQQLGDPANSAAIKAGKMRVEYSQQA